MLEQDSATKNSCCKDIMDEETTTTPEVDTGALKREAFELAMKTVDTKVSTAALMERVEAIYKFLNT